MNSKRTTICAVVTPCSATKSAPQTKTLRAAKIPLASQQRVAEKWLEMVRAAVPAVAAGDLYAGRGFHRARQAAEVADAHLYIVSAGLGLLDSTRLVPSYDLSAGPASQSASVAGRVRGRFSASKWWADVVQGPHSLPIESLFAAPGEGLVAVALTGPYVDLVSRSLESLSDDHLGRLRLFCGSQGLSPRLTTQRLPYDARFDRVVRGAKIDFWQRALEHFVRASQSNDLPADLAGQKQWVEQVLAKAHAPTAVSRQKVDDQDLVLQIEPMVAAGLSLAKVLRKLRDEFSISCGQERLTRLYQACT